MTDRDVAFGLGLVLAVVVTILAFVKSDQLDWGIAAMVICAFWSGRLLAAAQRR